MDPADRFAIEDLLTEFGLRVDHGRAPTVSELFVADGILVTPMFALQGPEQIAAHFIRRDSAGNIVSRHQWSNLRLQPLQNGDVSARMIVHTQLGTRTGPGPVRPDHSMVGDSVDIVRKTAGGWRFVERRLEVAFRWAPAPVTGEAPGNPPARG